MREAATVPRRQDVYPRRETQQLLRRVCAGGLNEVDHDCPFCGVAGWPAFSEVSLSHRLVEPLPGEVRRLFCGGMGGGIEGCGPGLGKLLPLGSKGQVRVWKMGRPHLLRRLQAMVRVMLSVKGRGKKFSLF